MNRPGDRLRIAMQKSGHPARLLLKQAGFQFRSDKDQLFCYGEDCAVDLILMRDDHGEWRVRNHTGDPDKSRELPMRTLDWITHVQSLGTGEIVLNCMASDGMRDEQRPA